MKKKDKSALNLLRFLINVALSNAYDLKSQISIVEDGILIFKQFGFDLEAEFLLFLLKRLKRRLVAL